MVRVLGLLLFSLFTVSFASADLTRPSNQPLPTTFSREKARAIYLDLARPPKSVESSLINPPPSESAHARFLDYFFDEIEPRHNEINDLSLSYAGYHLLLDSGLYDSEEEKKEWSREKAAILEKYAAFETDEVWQKKVRVWASMAGGLDGDLPDFARRVDKDMALSKFANEFEPLVKELYRLDQEVDEIASSLESKDRAMLVDKEINMAINDYFEKKVDFATSAKRLEELSAQAGAAVGRELIEKAGPQLQRIAVLRSLLAKSKGFETWADYRIALQANSHGPNFQSASQLVEFLSGLIAQTDEISKRAHQIGAAKVGRSLESLRPAAMSLLIPQAEQHIYGYFPRENIEKIWRETMKDSGFPESLTTRVMIDAFPRAGKQGHAYMFPARMNTIRKPVVDGRTLSIVVPPEGLEHWELPVTAIVQNFTDDTIDDLRTMFHEGGHGLDYAAHAEILAPPTAYGRDETPSTQAENFTLDYEYLRHYAMDREGKRPSEEQLRKYLRDKQILELIHLRGNLSQSLFDIELWRVDYSQPDAPKLWHRARELARIGYEKIRHVPMPRDLVETRGYAYFSTGHFYSGSVRYFGYVLAEVAAEMVNTKVLDRLEENSGRRSLFRQATLAEVITPFYKESRSRKFPESIEHFTGKSYSPNNFAQDFVKQVSKALDEWEEECESLLR